MSAPQNSPLLIRSGNFLFHCRNWFVPSLMGLMLVFARPSARLTGEDGSWWLLAGAAFAVVGQAIRLATIGLRYIERGGKNRRVYASKLVTDGIYRHVRNPMYVGNILIAIGLLMFSGSVAAAAVGIPFFLFAYRAITAAEEAYLHENFGAEFDAYCGRVNRFLPGLTGWQETKTEVAFEWKRSLRKDYGNVLVLALGLILLPLWRLYFTGPSDAFRNAAPGHVSAIGAAVVVYLTVRVLKKTGRLADSAQPADSSVSSPAR